MHFPRSGGTCGEALSCQPEHLRSVLPVSCLFLLPSYLAVSLQAQARVFELGPFPAPSLLDSLRRANTWCSG